MKNVFAFLSVFLFCVCSHAQITVLGRNTNDTILKAVFNQNSSASNTVAGLNAYSPIPFSDGIMSTNEARLNGTNVFTGTNTFNLPIVSAGLNFGVSAHPLTKIVDATGAIGFAVAGSTNAFVNSVGFYGDGSGLTNLPITAVPNQVLTNAALLAQIGSAAASIVTYTNVFTGTNTFNNTVGISNLLVTNLIAYYTNGNRAIQIQGVDDGIVFRGTNNVITLNLRSGSTAQFMRHPFANFASQYWDTNYVAIDDPATGLLILAVTNIGLNTFYTNGNPQIQTLANGFALRGTNNQTAFTIRPGAIGQTLWKAPDASAGWAISTSSNQTQLTDPLTGDALLTLTNGKVYFGSDRNDSSFTHFFMADDTQTGVPIEVLSVENGDVIVGRNIAGGNLYFANQFFSFGTNSEGNGWFLKITNSVYDSVWQFTGKPDALTLGTNGNLTIAGTFTGNGSGLTALNATQLTSGTVPAARLPNPSSSTLGGVQSAAAVSHQFLTSISTAGVPALAQPAFSDISGSLAVAQLPSASLTNNNVGAATFGSSVTASSFSGAGSGLTGVWLDADTFARSNLNAVIISNNSTTIDGLQLQNVRFRNTNIYTGNYSSFGTNASILSSNKNLGSSFTIGTNQDLTAIFLGLTNFWFGTGGDFIHGGKGIFGTNNNTWLNGSNSYQFHAPNYGLAVNITTNGNLFAQAALTVGGAVTNQSSVTNNGFVQFGGGWYSSIGTTNAALSSMNTSSNNGFAQYNGGAYFAQGTTNVLHTAMNTSSNSGFNQMNGGTYIAGGTTNVGPFASIGSALTSAGGSITLAGASAVDLRSRFSSTTTAGVTAARPFANVLIASNRVSRGASADHPMIAQLAIQPGNVSGGTATISDTASLYLEGTSTNIVSGRNWWFLARDAVGVTTNILGLTTNATTGHVELTGVANLNLNTNTAPVVTATETVTLNSNFQNNYAGRIDLTVIVAYVDNVGAQSSLTFTNLTTLENYVLGNSFSLAGNLTNSVVIADMSPGETIKFIDSSTGAGASVAIVKAYSKRK